MVKPITKNSLLFSILVLLLCLSYILYLILKTSASGEGYSRYIEGLRTRRTKTLKD